VEANLKAFYRVIAKLEGKEIDVAPAAAAIPEAAVPAAEADDDIYDFDIAKSNTKEASETEAEKEPADSDDDDIYAFDLPTAEPEPKTVDADEPEEDLYSPAVTSEEDDDLYSIEPVTPAADASPSLDDDIELPPMDMSLLDEPKEESPTKTRSDDVELPPMDMSLLDESKATESFDDVELPPMPSLEDDLPESASVPELHYDAAQAAAEIGLPASLVEELTKDFVSDAEGVKADLTAAAEAVNVAEWQSIASTLKGAADNLRMTEVAEALRSLANANDEQKAKESVDMFYGYVTQLKK
jgi:ribosomal protein L12E/L44/L45/RPP1/RPP2/HPt (histidine-containing phosphotransfer) domain-containing protein